MSKFGTSYFINARGERIPEAGSSLAVAPLPAHWGPPLWDRLHRGAETPEARATLLAEVTATVSGKCGCKQSWAKYLAEHPPAIESEEEFFAWTVEAHNDVRTRQGKSTFTVAEARALYAAEYAVSC